LACTYTTITPPNVSATGSQSALGIRKSWVGSLEVLIMTKESKHVALK